MEKSNIDHWYEFGMENVNVFPKIDGVKYHDIITTQLLIAILNILVIIAKKK